MEVQLDHMRPEYRNFYSQIQAIISPIWEIFGTSVQIQPNKGLIFTNRLSRLRYIVSNGRNLKQYDFRKVSTLVDYNLRKSTLDLLLSIRSDIIRHHFSHIHNQVKSLKLGEKQDRISLTMMVCGFIPVEIKKWSDLELQTIYQIWCQLGKPKGQTAYQTANLVLVWFSLHKVLDILVQELQYHIEMSSLKTMGPKILDTQIQNLKNNLPVSVTPYF